MEKKDVRIPQQKRSIEKKEKIIEAARLIFNENGYFGTNTPEIAKKADLSTGSVYAYFTDKKDILLACLNKFGNDLTDEICREISTISVTGDLLETTKKALKLLVKSHVGQSQLYHDEIMSLQYRDEDVKSYFSYVQKSLMAAVINEIEAQGYLFRRGREQTFLLFQMADGIQDELAFNHSLEIDHEILIDECARVIVSMLIKKENN
jgi:AcrR family transcriptional regulator